RGRKRKNGRSCSLPYVTIRGAHFLIRQTAVRCESETASPSRAAAKRHCCKSAMNVAPATDCVLHVQQFCAGEFGLLLDEIEARLRLGAHQAFYGPRGWFDLFLQQDHAKESALTGIHGGFFELRGHHLAEALEAADFDLGVRVELLLEQCLFLLVVARVRDLPAV